MPLRPLRPCAWPGCRALVRGGPRCPKHTTQHWAEDARFRGTPRQRGIDSKWRKLRNAHLAAHPFCARCLERGIQRPAAIVHHLVEHRGNDALRLDPANVTGLCRSCHSVVHAARGLPGYRAPGGGR